MDSDTHLLRAWADGDPRAGETLLQRLLPGIYGLCLRILRSEADAQDAAQETMARLVQARNGVHDVRKWAATVAMNLCMDVKRRRAREIPEELEISTVPEPLPSVEPERLRQAMRDLPERYQAVLHMHFVLDLKPRDIAEAMNLEPGTARVLLHRALAALRRKLT